MKIWCRRFLIALLAGSMVAVVACSDDDATENDADPDAGDEADIEDIDDNHYEPGNADFRSDYQLILNEFAFDRDSPGGDTALNNVIDHFIRDQTMSTPIIVLVELTDIDPASEEMMIRAGAGLHAGDPGGGEYVWDDEIGEPDSTHGSFDEEGYLEAELELLNFVATVQTDEETMKTIIPIRDIDLEALLRADEDGSNPRIIDADLDGVIVYDEVEDLEITMSPGEPGVSLVEVLDKDDMNHIYDPDDEGIEEENAWFMSAAFSAEETVILD